MRLFLLSLLATGVFASLFLAGRGAFAEDAPAGSYECWYFSTPQPLQNFNLKCGSYTDSSGSSGSVAGSGGKMTFSGGNSFVNGNGEEQFFCQLAQ